MTSDQNLECRHFASYTGVELPLKLITPLNDEAVDRRITYFRGYYDAQSRLVAVEKVVYGEIEFEHRYTYHSDGRLKSAELLEPDEEPRVLQFD
jgi:hypothetical protein